MCEFIELTHVMPGWGCCRCRSYNGLQRKECMHCGVTRHEITIPPHVKQCPKCGFGWTGGLPKRNLEGRHFRGRCPSCNTQVEAV
jgi:hypothetical protein